MEIRSGNESGTRKLLRRFFTYYRPHRKLFALDFSCAVLSGVLELGFPMAVGLFVDRLLPGQDWRLILVAAAALLAVYLLNTGLMIVVTYWGHMLGHQYRDRDAPQELRPPAEALVPLLRQPEDRAPGGAGDEGSGRDRRGRPPRAGGSLRRGDDLHRRVRPDVHRQRASWR